MLVDTEYIAKHTFRHPLFFIEDFDLNKQEKRLTAIKTLLAGMEKRKFHTSIVYAPTKTGTGLDKDIRNSQTSFLSFRSPLNSELKNFALSINKKYWKFSRLGFERAQIAKYSKDCFFNWHADIDTLSSHRFLNRRVATALLLISNPDDYEGGHLEFLDWNGRIVRPKLKQGQIITFPPTLHHRVTRVASGIRYSLTTWGSLI